MSNEAIEIINDLINNIDDTMCEIFDRYSDCEDGGFFNAKEVTKAQLAPYEEVMAALNALIK